MRASQDTYEIVAKECSAYEPAGKDVVTNGCPSCDISCTNCTHFDSEQFCKLDLYDEILQRHKIEQ